MVNEGWRKEKGEGEKEGKKVTRRRVKGGKEEEKEGKEERGKER